MSNPSTKPDTITLNKNEYQDGVNALKYASTTFEQISALLSAIQTSDSLAQVKALADMGSTYAMDMGSYCDSSREDLAGAA